MKLIFNLILLLTVTTFSQIFTEEDVYLCEEKISIGMNFEIKNKPIGDVIVEIGKTFIGTDYEAFALEKDGKEQLIINLTGLDCTTFLENAVTFARLIKQNKTTFEDYISELTYIRYRDGIIDEYPSRLHYFSDWIHNNIKKGIIEDVTPSIGGELTSFNLFFMSKNPDKYKHLNENPKFVPIIAKHEKEINSRNYYFIPKQKVSAIEKGINNGDLIAITTNIKGLDISHVGIAVKMPNGRIHFMHAPQAGKKVQITDTPLGDYLSKIKNQTGIIVLRVKEV